MDRPLVGRSILVVEDNPVIAMDVEQGLEAAGACVSRARTLCDALSKVECPDLSAAVLDHSLNDGDASQICDRLDQRNIPFVVYSGYDYVEGPCSEGRHVRKPIRPQALVAAVVDLFREKSSGRGRCGPPVQGLTAEKRPFDQ
jgi:DNA-binding response OmpR family regulator